MVLAADMLARSGALRRVPDVYALPPDVIAAAGAMLGTSGLLNKRLSGSSWNFGGRSRWVDGQTVMGSAAS
jgi:hypothetical protein